VVAKARRVALETLMKILNEGAYSNIALDNALSSVSLKDDDKALATELVYGTLKRLVTIDMMIGRNSTTPMDKIEDMVLGILRMSVYQLKYLDRIPDYAVVSDAVELAKEWNPRVSGFVNAVLRSISRDDSVPKFRSKLERMAYEESFPLWMVMHFSRNYKSRTQEILEGLNERPAVTYRVNTLRITRDKALSELRSDGFSAEPTAVSPFGIIVSGGGSVAANRFFSEGLLTVQDESSMLAAPLLEPVAGGTYLDLCSAPGGKATHIAELSGDRARVLAYDIYEAKIRTIMENADRLKLNGIEAGMHDAGEPMPEFFGIGSVLLDAPCSGLGIIRKKPDIKHTKTQEEMDGLPNLQRRLMDVAKLYVKTGGSLVYSTCTLNPSENEDNVRWFLENNPDFEAERIQLGDHPNLIYSEEGFVTVLPTGTMDGFFLSKLVRRTSKS
jgi:16S rRNA (cytosine967-C5)-methyltransferase